jgi:hypothetical protein
MKVLPLSTFDKSGNCKEPLHAFSNLCYSLPSQVSKWGLKIERAIVCLLKSQNENWKFTRAIVCFLKYQNEDWKLLKSQNKMRTENWKSLYAISNFKMRIENCESHFMHSKWELTRAISQNGDWKFTWTIVCLLKSQSKEWNWLEPF